MSKELLKDPEALHTFKSLVSAFGGLSQTNWTVVADQVNLKMQKQRTPIQWKAIGEILYREKQVISSEKKGQIIRTQIHGIENNFNPILIANSFLDKQLSRHEYYYTMFVILSEALERIIRLFSKRKVQDGKMYKKFAYKATYFMLRTLKLNKDDQYTKEIKECATYYKEMLTCYSYNLHLERPELFHELQKVVTRKKLEKVLFYLHFLDDIKKASKQINRTVPHPFLFNQDYQKLVVFQELFDHHDWRNKLDYYQEAAQDTLEIANRQFQCNSMYYKANDGKIKSTKPKKTRFGIPKGVLYRDKKTEVFEECMLSSLNQKDQVKMSEFTRPKEDQEIYTKFDDMFNQYVMKKMALEKQ